MLASRGKNLAVRTSAALITEERSDVGPTSLARTDSHHALVAVRETVAGTNRQVHHRTDSARTSSATPADWPAGLSVGLTDLTHGTLDASTRVCNTVSADSIHSFIHSFVSLIMPPTTRNGHTTSNHCKQKPNP